jgi:hypothetical protein
VTAGPPANGHALTAFVISRQIDGGQEIDSTKASAGGSAFVVRVIAEAQRNE